MRAALFQIVLSADDIILDTKLFKEMEADIKQKMLQELCVHMCGTISNSFQIEVEDKVQLEGFSFGEIDWDTKTKSINHKTL